MLGYSFKELKIAAVYKITCIITGDFYIGASSNIHHRWSRHFNAFKHNRNSNNLLQSLWNKHGGLKSFKFEILEEIPNPDNTSIKKAE